MKKKLFSVPENTNGFVFLCIWMVIAIVCFVIALSYFTGHKEETGFGAWLIAGAICAIPLLGFFIPAIFNAGANAGAGRGFAGMIGGLIGAALGSALIGIPFLAAMMLGRGITMIVWIIRAAKGNKAN